MEGTGFARFKVDDTPERNDGDMEPIPGRYGIAFLGASGPATIVEAIPCCCNDQGPKKVINAGEYLRRILLTLLQTSLHRNPHNLVLSLCRLLCPLPYSFTPRNGT